MFVCTDVAGVRTYQNSDGGKGCMPLNLNPITIVPGTRPSSVEITSEPRSPAPSRSSGKKSPANVYDYDAKKDRQKILEEELRLENSKLASLTQEYNNGKPKRLGSEKNYQKYLDRTERLSNEIKVTKENIEILEREMDKLLP